jgi:hypothetical protein
VKAVINGDRIECGKCGALLVKCILEKGKIVKEDVCKLEIKCKHKDRGHSCDTINEILL